jgi:hypothetical protein
MNLLTADLAQFADPALFASFHDLGCVTPRALRIALARIAKSSNRLIMVKLGMEVYEVTVGRALKVFRDAYLAAFACGMLVSARLVGRSSLTAPLGAVDPMYLDDAEIAAVCQATGIVLRKKDKDGRALPFPVGRPSKAQQFVDKRLNLTQKREMLISELLKLPAAVGRWPYRSVQHCYQHLLAQHLHVERPDKEYGSSSKTEYKWFRSLLGHPTTSPMRSVGGHREWSTALPFKAELIIASFIEAQLWAGKPVFKDLVKSCLAAVLDLITRAYHQDGETPPPGLSSALTAVLTSASAPTGFLKRWKLRAGRGRSISCRRSLLCSTENLKRWFNNTSVTIRAFEALFPRQLQTELAHRVFNFDETYMDWSKARPTSLRMAGVPFLITEAAARNSMVSLLCAVSAAGNILPLQISLPLKPSDDPLVPLPPKWERGRPVAMPHPPRLVRTGNGYCRSPDLEQYLEFLHKGMQDTLGLVVSPESPVLLFLDNCVIHKSNEFIATAKRLGLWLIFLPPYTTHMMQPLDKALFSTFKNSLMMQVKREMSTERTSEFFSRHVRSSMPTTYDEERKQFSRVGKEDIPWIATIAWERLKEKDIREAFASTGIWPFSERGFLNQPWTATADLLQALQKGTVHSSLAGGVNQALQDALHGSPDRRGTAIDRLLPAHSPVEEVDTSDAETYRSDDDDGVVSEDCEEVEDESNAGTNEEDNDEETEEPSRLGAASPVWERQSSQSSSGLDSGEMRTTVALAVTLHATTKTVVTDEFASLARNLSECWRRNLPTVSSAGSEAPVRKRTRIEEDTEREGLADFDGRLRAAGIFGDPDHARDLAMASAVHEAEPSLSPTRSRILAGTMPMDENLSNITKLSLAHFFPTGADEATSNDEYLEKRAKYDESFLSANPHWREQESSLHKMMRTLTSDLGARACVSVAPEVRRRLMGLLQLAELQHAILPPVAPPEPASVVSEASASTSVSPRRRNRSVQRLVRSAQAETEAAAPSTSQRQRPAGLRSVVRAAERLSPPN